MRLKLTFRALERDQNEEEGGRAQQFEAAVVLLPESRVEEIHCQDMI